MRQMTTYFRLAVLVIMLVALGAMSAQGATAQDNTFEFPITKLDCTSDPGRVSLVGLEVDGLPEGCTYGVGQTFTVTAADGTTLGSCTIPAGPPPTCFVSVSVPSTVTVTEDVSTAALGFAPRQNPITVSVEPNTEAGVLFVNLPVALPVTGTGSTATSMDAGTLVALLGLLSLLSAVAAVTVRRRPLT